MTDTTSNKKTNLLFLVLGLLGIIWFFMDFSRLWLPSKVVFPVAETAIIAKTDSLLQQWDFEQIDGIYSIKQGVDEINIDTLQSIYGSFGVKNKLIQAESDGVPTLPLFVSEVVYRSKGIQGTEYLKIEYSQNFKPVNFKAQRSLIQDQNWNNSKLLKQYFEANTTLKIKDRGHLDSLIANLVSFQRQDLPANEYSALKNALNVDKNTTEELEESIYSQNLIRYIAEYYIENSYWSGFDFKWDTPEFIEGDINYYRFILKSRDEFFGLNPFIELEVLPSGGLLNMQAHYWDDSPPGDRSLISFESNMFAQIAILIFGVWLLIIFYFRIKARAVDTGPALFAAVFAGFMVPIITSLAILKLVPLNGFRIGADLINLLFAFGLIGAFSSVGFFLLTAVSDSITRQYWPEKLYTWDTIRQGMFNNKPNGRAMLRGISISGILIALYILLARFVPQAYLSGKIVFISQEFVFAPLANLLLTIVISSLFILSTYLIIASQIFGRWKVKWLIPLATGLASLVLNISVVQILPLGLNFGFSFLVGFILGLFYIRYDFLTIVLAYFIFLNFISTAQGWGLKDSPDQTVFIFTAFILVLFLCFGIYFVLKGPERDELTNYVPEYLEKIAQEQRVDQELKIARDIQVVFFPNKIPETAYFDIAAKCEPAFETGGDFYEFIKLDENKMGVAIGDVSGKGIKAAFYMTFIKGVFQSLAKVLSSPKDLMVQVNSLFMKNATKGTFITSIYGILDSENNTFTYIRAGHNKVLYYSSKDGNAVYRDSSGLALGMANDAIFERENDEWKLHLNPKDVIVLYTDGIVEAKNSKNQYYGDGRLQELVEEHRNEKSDTILNLIMDDVRNFCGPQNANDDMTLIVIKA